MIVLKIILFIWQLPQNIIGAIVVLIEGAKKRESFGITWFSAKKPKFFMKNCSVSLGCFIIADPFAFDEITLKHENGHQWQSIILGPYYLLFIGLPSVIGNLIDRHCHKKWDNNRRSKWYYTLPWEKAADVLGNVERF